MNPGPVAAIRNGIAGALALTGVCLLLLLVAVMFSAPSPLVAKVIDRCTLPEVLVATCTIGFVLGVALTRQLPIAQKGVLPLAVAAIPLIAGVYLLDTVTKRVSVPKTIRLANPTDGTTKLHLKVPTGRGFTLGLHVSGEQPNKSSISSYKFSGRIRIAKRDSLVTDFPVGSDSTLSASGDYALTGVERNHTNGPPALSQFIRPGEDCDIQITLDPQPPPSSFFWLHWLQPVKDARR